MKKLAAVVLGLTMALAMGISVFAESTPEEPTSVVAEAEVEVEAEAEGESSQIIIDEVTPGTSEPVGSEGGNPIKVMPGGDPNATPGQYGREISNLYGQQGVDSSNYQDYYNKVVAMSAESPSRIDPSSLLALRGAMQRGLEQDYANEAGIVIANNLPGTVSVSGAAFAVNPAAGQVSVTATEKTDTTAPYALDISMTADGVAVQPGAILFITVALPEALQKSIADGYIEIKHISDNGVEVLRPITEIAPGGVVKSITFAVNHFSTFEFRYVANGTPAPTPGPNPNPVNEPVIKNSASPMGTTPLVAIVLLCAGVLGTATVATRRRLAAK